MPKDVLTHYHCKPASSTTSQFGSAASLNDPWLNLGSNSSIKFDQKRYQEFVTLRTAGRGPWEVEKKTLKI